MSKRLLLIFLFFVLAHPVSAAESPKFSVSYDINYSVSETGLTTVTQNIRLTNLTSEFYASQYTSRIGTAQIQNLRAFDKLGPLHVFTAGDSEEREIKINFNETIYGKDKTLNWTLVFESSEIAKKNGRIWEITLPKPSSLENVDQYNVTLQVPSSFKDPLYLKPQPQTNYYWTKDQIQNAGISVAFGDFQVFDFTLTHKLFNQNFYPATMEIVLPPDTQYQKVFLSNLDPKPLDVTVDTDGNWIGKYSLSPRQKITVISKGQAQVFLKPRFSLLLPDPTIYLLPQKYWEANDTEIKNIAQSLGSPDKIYSFVSTLLTYDITRTEKNLPRLGAKNALNNPQSATCMEFTDLFIALARAANIPSRQLSGYAFTKQKNPLHAWPEFYDPALGGTWRMIDPTWAKTTGGIDYFNNFDLNHFILAINGSDPIKPLPPKDIEITFVSAVPAVTAGAAEIDLVDNNLILKNVGRTLITTGEITLSSPKVKINPDHLNRIVLPPYAVRKIPLDLRPEIWSFGQKSIITIKSGGKTLKFNVKINLLYRFFISLFQK